MATEPTGNRKLAAILMADVVGYSRLMGRNENETIERLKAYHHSPSERDSPTDQEYGRTGCKASRGSTQSPPNWTHSLREVLSTPLRYN